MPVSPDISLNSYDPLFITSVVSDAIEERFPEVRKSDIFVESSFQFETYLKQFGDQMDLTYEPLVVDTNDIGVGEKMAPILRNELGLSKSVPDHTKIDSSDTEGPYLVIAKWR